MQKVVTTILAVRSVRGLLYCYRTHIVGSWDVVGRLFSCSVLRCSTAVPGTTYCCVVEQGGAVVDRPLSPDRSLACSPSVVHPLPLTSRRRRRRRAAFGRLGRSPGVARPLARSLAVIRSPAAALVNN